MPAPMRVVAGCCIFKPVAGVGLSLRKRSDTGASCGRSKFGELLLIRFSVIQRRFLTGLHQRFVLVEPLALNQFGISLL